MSSAIADRAKIFGTLETLVIGAAGGLLFLWLNLPGGLISGAMVAVGIAALAGRPVTMPAILTQTVLLLLGITLGSLVSRQLIQHMSAYPLTIGLLALSTFCSTFGSSFYLQRMHGWDQTSALLAGSPGALSQIVRLAARTRRVDRRRHRGCAGPAADEFSGELDVRRDDRLQRAAWHLADPGRP